MVCDKGQYADYRDYPYRERALHHARDLQHDVRAGTTRGALTPSNTCTSLQVVPLHVRPRPIPGDVYPDDRTLLRLIRRPNSPSPPIASRPDTQWHLPETSWTRTTPRTSWRTRQRLPRPFPGHIQLPLLPTGLTTTYDIPHTPDNTPLDDPSQSSTQRLP